MAARDYKHRAGKKPEKRPIAPWVWLLLGFLAGAGLVGWLCYRYTPRDAGPGWIGERPPVAQETPPPPRPAPEPPPRPEFKFYNLLPEQEVVVPEEELHPKARRPVEPAAPPARKATPAARASAPSPASGYLLQVAAMRSAREADAVKARLALLGFQAQVSRAAIHGSTWYRVRLGPYHSAARVQQVRRRLAAQGYKALVVKAR